MFFTLPNLACGHMRRGFDTISVNFQQNASDRNVYTNSTPTRQRTPVQSDDAEDQQQQPKKDAVSHYSASWDMMETPAAASAPSSFSPHEPLLLRLSLLGGPRTRRWSLDQVHMMIAIEGKVAHGVPFYLPTVPVKSARDPWPLSDTKALRPSQEGILLWHPDPNVPSPLQNYEQLILHHQVKITLRLRLTSDDSQIWRDCLLSFRFSPGSMRFHREDSPLSSPSLSSCSSSTEDYMGDDKSRRYASSGRTSMSFGSGLSTKSEA